jgi:hypothetical protein
MPISSQVARERSRVAGFHARNSDDPELVAARRDLAYAKLTEHVRRVVDAAPPATPDQLARIAAALQPAAAAEPMSAA